MLEDEYNFFCDEKDENGNLIVSKFGELIIDAKDKYDPLKKKVIVEMKIGGTFVSVTARYENSNEEVNVKCVFD